MTHNLLVCTVGGSPEPIATSIKHWQPKRVILAPSVGDKGTQGVAEKLASELDVGACQLVVLNDAQDFNACVRQLHLVNTEVERWQASGADYQVVVDFTGGTKVMSAAMALVARRWRCLFSYIGGSARTKDGLGIVVDGAEQMLVTQNPWDALGYQAVEEACLLFDQYAFSAAESVLDAAQRKVEQQSVKRELSTCIHLCQAFGNWDRFQHKAAAQSLEQVLKNVNDLTAVFTNQRAESLRSELEKSQKFLNAIVERPQSQAMIVDLLGNAQRRGAEGRYDDAVARLYRAIESMAQLALAEHYQIPSTKAVPVDRIPTSLRGQFSAEGDTVMLGLQHAFLLLRELGSELGQRFEQLKLAEVSSPLTARNSSILAHGFAPVRKQVFDRLTNAALQLGDPASADLPKFPQLSAVQASTNPP